MIATQVASPHERAPVPGKDEIRAWIAFAAAVLRDAEAHSLLERQRTDKEVERLGCEEQRTRTRQHRPGAASAHPFADAGACGINHCARPNLEFVPRQLIARLNG